MGVLFAALRVRGAMAQGPPTEVLTFPALADSYVDSAAPSSNYDTGTVLRVDGSPERITYLRFAVTGVNGRNVQRARLKLGCANASRSGGTIHRITSGSWSAASVTWNSKPALDGPGLQTLDAVTVGQGVEFNLDGVVRGDGTYDLAIDSGDGDGVDYVSSAATSG